MSQKQNVRFVIIGFLCLVTHHCAAQWWQGNDGGEHNNGMFGLGALQNPFLITTTTAKPHQPVNSRVNNQNHPQPNNNQNHQQQAHKTHKPCIGNTVTMTRPAGEITNQNNYWMGRVDLSDFSYLRSIKLVIEVDHPAKIEVDENKGTISGPHTGTMFRVTYVGEPPEVESVDFKIIGTKGKQFPNLVKLHLNNRDICKGAVAWINNYADTLQEAGLGPAGQYIQNVQNFWGGILEGNTGQNKQPAVRPFSTPKPTTRATTTTKPTTTTRVTKPPVASCGRRLNNREGYITSGYATRPGDWPWHAAIYHVSKTASKYVCGGTLLNPSTVLTAAHCLYSSGREIVPSRVRVQLGKFQLSLSDSNTEEFSVDQVIVHPEYSPIDYQDDIGILKLANRVTYTNFIQPVCLWQESQKALSNVEGKKGFVVGWGLTEDDGLAEELHEGTMPVVSFLTCLESNRDFFGPVLSDFNYCAGYRNGTSVCNGDSGGGMFFEVNGSWRLRGLVSFSSVREDRDVCNPQNYVIFTDVAKYLDWIDKHL